MSFWDQAADGSLGKLGLRSALTEKKIDINALDPKTQRTALALAAQGDHDVVVTRLVQMKPKEIDTNKTGPDGKTPLYLTASSGGTKAKLIAEQLLEYGADVDATNDMNNNDTPLMAAVRLGKDIELIKLLLAKGASKTKKNNSGESAESLAEKVMDSNMREALLPLKEQGKGNAALITLITSLVLFMLNYFDKFEQVKAVIVETMKAVTRALEHQQANKDHTNATQDVKDPKTAEDFKKNIDNAIRESGLGSVIDPDDPMVEEIAKKAAEVMNDPSNPHKDPEDIKTMIHCALYQPVLYCDDSGSMAADGKMDALKGLVERITHVMTLAAPTGNGAHLRFINKDIGQANNLNATQIATYMNFQPVGGTPIGTNMRERVFKPFLYDIFDDEDVIQRPFLILVLTDGMPEGEPVEKFKAVITELGDKLEQQGYKRPVVKFVVSQIGKDSAATKFLDLLANDKTLDPVLYRTAERMDDKYKEFRNNANALDSWLLKTLRECVDTKRREDPAPKPALMPAP